MKALLGAVEFAQLSYAALLRQMLRGAPPSVVHYQRYLSMQYHLTRGVQRYFMRAAAHPDLASRKPLRKFLFDFANEEEQHYQVAASDLARTNLALLPEPFDVTLWHAYFRSIVDERPFLRLGAACVLESITGGAARDVTKGALVAPFLTAENTRFVMLHLHEAVPHGEQILAAMETARLSPAQMEDLVLGARQGTVMYLRMAEWALCAVVDADSGDVEVSAKACLPAVQSEVSTASPA